MQNCNHGGNPRVWKLIEIYAPAPGRFNEGLAQHSWWNLNFSTPATNMEFGALVSANLSTYFDSTLLPILTSQCDLAKFG